MSNKPKADVAIKLDAEGIHGCSRTGFGESKGSQWAILGVIGVVAYQDQESDLCVKWEEATASVGQVFLEGGMMQRGKNRVPVQMNNDAILNAKNRLVTKCHR